MAVEMKDSGIQWIGEIPKHWSVEQHKRIMYKVKHIQEHYTNENILSLTMNGVIVRDLNAGGKMPTTFDGYQKVYPGNLLLCLFDIDVTPRCVGAIHDFGLTSPAYSQFVLRENAYVEYYNYLLRYMDDEKCLLHQSKNLRSSLTESDFGLIKSILPPYNEQEKISSFLDTKCGEIDELVDLETQMIDELKAYKQSIITEAVTRGLNPNVPMRNSGIEWIGEIPQHWKTTKLKFVGSARNGLTYTPTDVCDEEQGLLVLRSSNIQNGQLCFDDNVYVSKSVDSRLMMQEGDILICSRNGSASLVGKCALIRDNLNATFGAFMMRYRSNIDKSYTLYLINTTIGQYKPMFSTSTINQLTNEMIGSMQVAIPPLQEQRTIAEYLDSKCADIDALIALRQDKIDTLREYKKSLIFEYVTGKKQVV
jgi:type I restriction enzyme S subunit